jgi:hypothetical protein
MKARSIVHRVRRAAALSDDILPFDQGLAHGVLSYLIRVGLILCIGVVALAVPLGIWLLSNVDWDFTTALACAGALVALLSLAIEFRAARMRRLTRFAVSPQREGEGRPRGAVTLPRLILAGPRAAGGGDAYRPSVTWSDDTTGLSVTQRQMSPGTVEIRATVDREIAPPDGLLTLLAGTEEEPARFLMILTRDENGQLVGDLLVHQTESVFEVSFIGQRDAASLGPDDVDAVRRSVSATSRRGRNAWRAIARERDRDDPIVAAIGSGLN